MQLSESAPQITPETGLKAKAQKKFVGLFYQKKLA
jgi:hypothetical protein